MTDITDELDRLEGEIRSMKIEFDRFFNGARDIPPEEQRNRLARAFRRLQGRPLLSFAERFRCGALEARFNSLSDLYGRRLREHEAGLLETSSGTANGPDPYDGVVFTGPASRAEAMAIYEELYGRDGRTAKTDFGSFLAFLERKADKIRRLTDCPAVQFRVVDRRGRLSLKAKPLKNPTS